MSQLKWSLTLRMSQHKKANADSLLVLKWCWDLALTEHLLTLRSGKVNLAPYGLDGLHSRNVRSDLLLHQASGYPLWSYRHCIKAQNIVRSTTLDNKSSRNSLFTLFILHDNLEQKFKVTWMFSGCRSLDKISWVA